MSRKDDIRKFLATTEWANAEITPLAGDASFRRYDRVVQGNKKAVLMDAPPVFEDTRPFFAVAKYIHSKGLRAPAIYAFDFDKGFLLLEDLGDDLFKRVLERQPEKEASLYKRAVDELISLNKHDVPNALPLNDQKYELPIYDMALYLTEIALLTDWYYPAIHGKRLSIQKREEFMDIWRDALSEISNIQECMVLRDYHAENLLDMEDGGIGQLDFQDAVLGHLAYDLVSLLQDARRDVTPKVEEEMVAYYAGEMDLNLEKFKEHYAILGAQRNIKIIGIFARLYLRDGKDAYLGLQPRMWGLLERCLEHPSLGRVKGWLDENIPNLRDVPLMAKKLNPDQAIILAAGLGTRMLPLTEDMPKPLIKVAGKEMLTWTLDALAWAGVKRAVINKHHHADQIDMFVNERIDWRPEILLSDESDLLMDSGGGIKKGLKQLSNEPFFIINSDMIWQNEGLDALTRLATAWDDNMDMLMLLIKREAAHGHDGAGDFHMAKDGCLSWRGNSSTADYLYSGIMIIRPECFEDTPDEPFSLKILFDRAEKQKKLFGIVHTGSWYHVGTPEAIGETEKRLKGK